MEPSKTAVVKKMNARVVDVRVEKIKSIGKMEKTETVNGEGKLGTVNGEGNLGKISRPHRMEIVRDDYLRNKLHFTGLGISDCSFRQGLKPTKSYIARGNVPGHSFEGKILISVSLAVGVVRDEKLVAKVYDLTKSILGDDCILETITETNKL